MFFMQNQDQQNGTGDYHLVTTISMPVYDRRENAVSCLNFQVPEAPHIFLGILTNKNAEFYMLAITKIYQIF